MSEKKNLTNLKGKQYKEYINKSIQYAIKQKEEEEKNKQQEEQKKKQKIIDDAYNIADANIKKKQEKEKLIDSINQLYDDNLIMNDNNNYERKITKLKHDAYLINTNKDNILTQNEINNIINKKVTIFQKKIEKENIRKQKKGEKESNKSKKTPQSIQEGIEKMNEDNKIIDNKPNFSDNKKKLYKKYRLDLFIKEYDYKPIYDGDEIIAYQNGKTYFKNDDNTLIEKDSISDKLSSELSKLNNNFEEVLVNTGESIKDNIVNTGEVIAKKTQDEVSKFGHVINKGTNAIKYKGDSKIGELTNLYKKTKRQLGNVKEGVKNTFLGHDDKANVSINIRRTARNFNKEKDKVAKALGTKLIESADALGKLGTSANAAKNTAVTKINQFAQSANTSKNTAVSALGTKLIESADAVSAAKNTAVSALGTTANAVARQSASAVSAVGKSASVVGKSASAVGKSAESKIIALGKTVKNTLINNALTRKTKQIKRETTQIDKERTDNIESTDNIETTIKNVETKYNIKESVDIGDLVQYTLYIKNNKFRAIAETIINNDSTHKFKEITKFSDINELIKGTIPDSIKNFDLIKKGGSLKKRKINNRRTKKEKTPKSITKRKKKWINRKSYKYIK
jgi:hypothetical protein